jgi:hypothetical protein
MDDHLFFCAERSPPIEEVIAAGVVPRFVEFLVRGDFPQLQVLTKIVIILVCLLSIVFECD